MRTFELAAEVPRIGSRAEILATWYLRFNGYFPIRGFVVHDAGSVKQRGGQITDADVLAVRLPHTAEIIKAPASDVPIVVKTDPGLDVRSGVTDFVIADVSSQSCKCNQLSEDGDIDIEYLIYCLRRFGYWPERKLARLAKMLSRKGCLERRDVRIRVLCFGVMEDAALRLPQITFTRMLEYMRTDLFECYDLADRMVVSDHKQWDPLICEVYRRLRGHKTRVSTLEEVVRWLFPGDPNSGERIGAAIGMVPG